MMKKKIIILLLFVIGINADQIKAQNQVVNLCYDEEYTERVSVVSDVDLTTLTIRDKLKFKQKKYSKQHHEYLNNTGNGKHDIHFVSHENMFPEWYTHPSTISSDQTGTKSYFATQNNYLPDGWTGSLKSKTDHGEYIEDNRTGERYLTQPYSLIADSEYQRWNESSKKHGFLNRFIYSYPSTSDLKEFRERGYDVSRSGSIIRVKNNSIILVWDIVEKIFVRQYIESNSVVKTIKTSYNYHQGYNDFLMHTVIISTPSTFENGDCYELVTRTSYTNYTSGCSFQALSIRDDKANISGKLYSKSELELFPNPASDQLNVINPNSKITSTLLITNISGEILLQRKVDIGIKSSLINISDFPSGMYIVKCTQGTDIYSSKFVKQ